MKSNRRRRLSVGWQADGQSRESRVESREQPDHRQIPSRRSLSSDSPLSTLHSPLFAVRTPTATVTDLGTEFGVEVANRGPRPHVFRGSVRVQAAGDGTD